MGTFGDSRGPAENAQGPTKPLHAVGSPARAQDNRNAGNHPGSGRACPGFPPTDGVFSKSGPSKSHNRLEKIPHQNSLFDSIFESKCSLQVHYHTLISCSLRWHCNFAWLGQLCIQNWQWIWQHMFTAVHVRWWVTLSVSMVNAVNVHTSDWR